LAALPESGTYTLTVTGTHAGSYLRAITIIDAPSIKIIDGICPI